MSTSVISQLSKSVMYIEMQNICKIYLKSPYYAHGARSIQHIKYTILCDCQNSKLKEKEKRKKKLKLLRSLWQLGPFNLYLSYL